VKLCEEADDSNWRRRIRIGPFNISEEVGNWCLKLQNVGLVVQDVVTHSRDYEVDSESHIYVVANQKQARSYVQGTDLDSEEFQDTRMFTYARLLLEEFCTSGIHRATQGEVKARNKLDGENFITLGQLCIVSFCAFWNDYLPREYVIAKGQLDPKERDERVVNDRLRLRLCRNLVAWSFSKPLEIGGNPREPLRPNAT
jgi:hypothetical protein